ncbi:MAG: SPFH domain-containing protein [Candidatus Nomurabacteria bacterium]|jgi:membrane protease subunit (stomatin/prohibitin family)|nr:SPFH domain-containing protein [Candidatus Nomurabacteria bacterium]
MGFIKAFTGALGGQFANQWLDYIAPPADMRDHTLLARGVPIGQNAGRGENTKGGENIITNGSKILVPEGVAAVTVENGGITGVIAEAGGYTYTSENVPEAKSLFSGNGFLASTLGASFEQFKYGGQPGNQQFVFYVSLKDIAGLKYGTQNPIRYKDANYANTMLAVTSNGTYTIKVVDPVLLFKNLVPADIVSGQGRDKFDLGDGDGGVEESLFAGFVGSLAAALSAYTKGGKSIDDIQGGTVEFAKAINEAVEANYQWGSRYGLIIVNVQPMGLDWDQPSVDLINKFNTGNLMQGGVGAAYAQTQIAEGVNAAGSNAGTAGMMGMGMGIGMMGGAAGMTAPVGMNPVAPAQPTPAPAPAPAPTAPVAAPAPVPAPEVPTPEAPVQEAPAPETPAPEAPAPETPAPETPTTPETPPAPETPDTPKAQTEA